MVAELERELSNKKDKFPATNYIFNEIKDAQSHVQDGRGGGKPSSDQETTGNENVRTTQEYSTGIRDPPG